MSLIGFSRPSDTLRAGLSKMDLSETGGVQADGIRNVAWYICVAIFLGMSPWITVMGQPMISVSAPASVRGGQDLPVSVLIENLGGIEAFGFELRYNENLITYNSATGTQKGALIQGFNNFLSNKVATGTIRVGGYGLTPTQASNGVLCLFLFTVKTGVADVMILDIRNPVDFPQVPTLVPLRINVSREPLSGSGMSAENARGRKGTSLFFPIEATLPAGSSVRGARGQINYDPGILDYLGVSKGDQVPSDYVLTQQLSSPGILNLGISGGSGDLSTGNVWKVHFQIKTSAILGRSTVTLTPEACYFTLAGNTQLPVAAIRNGSISVYPTGDANRDGNITIADVLTVILGTIYTAYADEFTDCNQDQSTNSQDIICTINALFSRGN